jgi:hypothetical protein
MTDEPQVKVENAENVNVPADPVAHPGAMYLIAFVTCGVLIGFGWVTFAVLSGDAGKGIDAATKGSVIQTWNNLAVAAAAVWTTSRVVDKIQGKRP